ncbi:hypothetical protein JCM6882_007385 [Rhodosporidiobolus microsporus]
MVAPATTSTTAARKTAQLWRWTVQEDQALYELVRGAGVANGNQVDWRVVEAKMVAKGFRRRDTLHVYPLRARILLRRASGQQDPPVLHPILPFSLKDAAIIIAISKLHFRTLGSSARVFWADHLEFFPGRSSTELSIAHTALEEKVRAAVRLVPLPAWGLELLRTVKRAFAELKEKGMAQRLVDQHAARFEERRIKFKRGSTSQSAASARSSGRTSSSAAAARTAMRRSHSSFPPPPPSHPFSSVRTTAEVETPAPSSAPAPVTRSASTSPTLPSFHSFARSVPRRTRPPLHALTTLNYPYTTATETDFLPYRPSSFFSPSPPPPQVDLFPFSPVSPIPQESFAAATVSPEGANLFNAFVEYFAAKEAASTALPVRSKKRNRDGVSEWTDWRTG